MDGAFLKELFRERVLFGWLYTVENFGQTSLRVKFIHVSQRFIKWYLGPNKLLRTEYGDMKSVRIGWAIRGSISDIELALRRCSRNWKDPSNFLQYHFKYALKIKRTALSCLYTSQCRYCSFEDHNSSVDEAVYTHS